MKRECTGLLRVFLALCLLITWQVKGQTLFFNTSSATQGNNTFEKINANGTGNTVLFTAIGGSSVSRCTALALDSWNGKVFLLDAGSNALWSVNLDGTGAALVKNGLTSFPSSLALDVINQKIYYTTTSASQGNNTVQRMDYTGNNNTVLFTAASATGGNGVQRCTALALDLLHSKIFISDAGSNALWSMSLSGSGLTLVKGGLIGAPRDLALDVTNQIVYFVTSSATQSANTIQSISYTGANQTVRFTASGTVQRCTALELDIPNGKIYFSDVGANSLWSLPIGGGSATLLNGSLPDSYVLKPRLLPSANVITVVNANDSGFGSLRTAIANVTSPGTINFSSVAFSSAPTTINLSTVGDTTYGPSSIRVDKQVTLVGPAGTTNGVTISRSNSAPAMRFFYVSSTGSLTLSNLTLANGLAQGFAGGGGIQRGAGGGGSAGLGGAIFNLGTVDIERCTLVGNQALGGPGGWMGGNGSGSGGGGAGLASVGGTGGSSVLGGTGGGPNGGVGGNGNAAGTNGGTGGGGGGGGSSSAGFGSGPGGSGGFGGGGGGGGAYDTAGYPGGLGGHGGNGGFGGGGGGGGAGTPDGVVGIGGFGGGNGGQGDGSGNIGSSGGGGGGLGGAVFNQSGLLVVNDSTFSANAAVGGAGGNYWRNLQPQPGLGLGGGIFNRNGTVQLVNTTFAFNRADQGGGGIFNLGDGAGQTGSVSLYNSIVGDTTSPGNDYGTTNINSGSITNFGGNNLVELNDGFTGSIVSTNDPKLGPLANNGGPTYTHALLNYSPAIDAGDNAFAAGTIDQRGYPRIADGDGNGSSSVDLGAVEDGLVRIRTVPQSKQSILANGFKLFLTGESNRVYVTEASTNLINWKSVLTNLLPNVELQVFDTSAGVGNTNRFYRLRTGP